MVGLAGLITDATQEWKLTPPAAGDAAGPRLSVLPPWWPHGEKEFLHSKSHPLCNAHIQWLIHRGHKSQNLCPKRSQLWAPPPFQGSQWDELKLLPDYITAQLATLRQNFLSLWQESISNTLPNKHPSYNLHHRLKIEKVWFDHAMLVIENIMPGLL